MRSELSYDGCGINGPDEYRSRIATFQNYEVAEKYGKLFAAAPDLLLACEAALENLSPMYSSDHFVIKRLRDAIGQTTGWQEVGTAGDYTIWQRGDCYNATHGDRPGPDDGGYFKLESLLKLKGLEGQFVAG